MMPRDARLGFVVGLALVILIAVIFYNGDGGGGGAGTAGSVGASDAKQLPQQQQQKAKAEAATKPATVVAAAAGRTEQQQPSAAKKVRTHVVQEGETLTSIAVKYYEDGSRDQVLYRANKSQLRSIADVPVGTELVVPDLTAK
jgi:nucleoid-associated protein YgaU